MVTTQKVLDCLTISLNTQADVLVVSDIHLAARITSASAKVQQHISERIDKLAGQSQSVVVLNGDIFELWAGKAPNVRKALLAHKTLTKSLKDFSELPDHYVVLVVGNHDGALAWDTVQQAELTARTGAQICLSLELELKKTNTKKPKKILFEHGHQLDSENSFADPRDPHDKPFGQRIVQNILPLVAQTQGELFSGIHHLSEPHQFTKYIASRIFYIEILSRAWWLLVPLLLLFAARMAVGFGVFASSGYNMQAILQLILYTEVAILITILVSLACIAAIMQKLFSRAKPLPGGNAGMGHNNPAKRHAQELIDTGYIGYITGHTHRPEIHSIDTGFYANSGCGTEMTSAAKSRLKMPKTYVSQNHLSWLELSLANGELEVREYKMISHNNTQSRLEKLFTSKTHLSTPLHVASHKVFEV